MEPGPIARAFELRTDRNHATAVMAALKMLAGAFPQYAARLDPGDANELRDSLEAWSVATDGYRPETVIEAARRLVRRMAAETRDYAPSASRLVAFCKEIAQEARVTEPDQLVEQVTAPPEIIDRILAKSKMRGGSGE